MLSTLSGSQSCNANKKATFLVLTIYDDFEDTILRFGQAPQISFVPKETSNFCDILTTHGRAAAGWVISKTKHRQIKYPNR